MTELMDKNLAVTSGDVSTFGIDRIFNDTVITISPGFPEICPSTFDPQKPPWFSNKLPGRCKNHVTWNRWHGGGMA